jgi:polyhydroxyalkanoate synthase
MIAVLIVVILLLLVAAVLCWLLIAATYSPPVTADEVHMVTTGDVWRIRLCRYKARGGSGEPVFFCHGFMSNQYNFAMPPGESMVDAFAEKGYDCWAIDLRGGRSSIAAFGRPPYDATVDDYLLRDIPAAIEYIRKATGFAKVHWVGHSMGGMLLYAYDATFGQDHVACATTLGSPIGFEGMKFSRPTVLFAIRKSSWHLFRALQRGLVALLSTFKISAQVVPMNWKNMNPKMVGRSLFATVEVPPIGVAEALSQAVLSKTWFVNDGAVDVYASVKRESHIPHFAIYGSVDPFVPSYTVEPFFDSLNNPDKKLLVLSKENGCEEEYSHVDLVFGRNVGTEVFAPIDAWLQAHRITERLKDGAAEGGEKNIEAAPGKLIEERDELVAAAAAVEEMPARIALAAQRIAAAKERTAAAKKPKAIAKKPAAAAKGKVAAKPAPKKTAVKKAAPVKKPAAVKKKASAKKAPGLM